MLVRDEAPPSGGLPVASHCLPRPVVAGLGATGPTATTDELGK